MDAPAIARCLLTLLGRDGHEYALVELAEGVGFATLRDGNVLQRSRFEADQLEASVLKFAALAGIITKPPASDRPGERAAVIV
jgi:hypothetical protein